MNSDFDIQLCSGTVLIHAEALPTTPVVAMICQQMIVGGISCAVLDGVDLVDPVLLPVENLDDFKRLGTLKDYLTDPRHDDIQETLAAIMDACVVRDYTPTLMVRAIEIVHAEGLSAEAAIAGAIEWGEFFRALANNTRAAAEASTAA